QAALDAMARGGIWDHLGGGFHRYAVDATWSVPHFEKMLYDNAQLARLYADAARRDGLWIHDRAPRADSAGADVRDPGALGLEALPALAWGPDRNRRIALATSGYALRELQLPDGGFQAAQDADTPDGEGAFFAWRPEELAESLEPEDRMLAAAWFGVEPGGNFEQGATVLSSRRDPASLPDLAPATDVARLGARLGGIYRRLRERRALRDAPDTDRKQILAWNGLMIDALARQSAGLGGPEGDALYLAATRSADHLLGQARLPDGELARYWIDGRAAERGFLDDHAALGGACLSLYEARFELRWFLAAQTLAEGMLERFADRELGGFFRSGPHHEGLIVRQKPLDDGALPSGNALAADLLLRLHALTGEARYIQAVEATLRLARPMMERAPIASAAMLRVLASWQVGMRALAVVGDPASGADALLGELRRRHRPGTVVAWAPAPDDPAARRIPLLADRRPPAGKAAAWLCRGPVCELPVTDPAALADLLDA
ncbi:MAG: thioredoxin domain-containing protein, partial [Chloroflexi bacterium]|nr:thioredoxin domain-containing protein [Chloroflexota bacterium]